MTLTADTIRDAQIRELIARGDLTAAELADCEHALRRRDRYWTRFQRNMQRGARVRCAAIFNARAAKRACPGREHRAHVGDVCQGTCCTECGGPIDQNEECRCES